MERNSDAHIYIHLLDFYFRVELTATTCRHLTKCPKKCCSLTYISCNFHALKCLYVVHFVELRTYIILNVSNNVQPQRDVVYSR